MIITTFVDASDHNGGAPPNLEVVDVHQNQAALLKSLGLRMRTIVYLGGTLSSVPLM